MKDKPARLRMALANYGVSRRAGIRLPVAPRVLEVIQSVVLAFRVDP